MGLSRTRGFDGEKYKVQSICANSFGLIDTCVAGAVAWRDASRYVHGDENLTRKRGSSININSSFLAPY